MAKRKIASSPKKRAFSLLSKEARPWHKASSGFRKVLVPIGIIVGVLLTMGAIALVFPKNAPRISLSARLVEVLDIAELSTSEIVYNGIADIYDDASRKIRFSVAYNATIKIGVQMNDIAFAIDEAQRLILPVLPAITIRSPVIDPNSLDYIPSNPNVDLAILVSACRADAQREAEESERLMSTAEENLKSIVEALILPLAESAGYKISW